ncbi:hypothetical protein [Streptomyces xanthophaeus]|uniref:hypothetical protein n=1 Tax=Streptomyces xanthophaeus TaxID=67385 RepID=UPI00233E8CCB|nr:hypothetical protein [Streptomyces xanthophaeus]
MKHSLGGSASLALTVDALRATGVLERIVVGAGRGAARAVWVDGMSAKAVATALGTTRSQCHRGR